jgi:hypothetical protein
MNALLDGHALRNVHQPHSQSNAKFVARTLKVCVLHTQAALLFNLARQVTRREPGATTAVFVKLGKTAAIHGYRWKLKDGSCY